MLKPKSKKICIFCSSSDTLPEIYYQKSVEFASILSNLGYDLVYGGGNIGIMGAVAREFKRNNRKVTSIIPKKLLEHVPMLDDITESIVVKDMSNRKRLMVKKSDAFIALPGGFGTLEEIFEVITLKQLDYIEKPIAFLNINGFFDETLKQLERIYKEGFAKESNRDLYIITDKVDDIVDYLSSYKELDISSKWIDKF